jgi:amino acid transporter
MAFLFVWQFLISGPLEVGSGLIAIAMFSNALSPAFAEFNKQWTWRWPENADLAITVSPARLGAFALGVLILMLLYRRITTLGRFTVTIWVGVLSIIAIILVDGFAHFDAARAFDFSGRAAAFPSDFALNLGAAMGLAMYSYLGYYNICYIGDEVRDPGRTIPRAIMLSAVLVCVLFVALHLAMMGLVSWHDVPTDPQKLDDYSLPADFMEELHGQGGATFVSLLLIWSCFGSAFAGLMGYSRIPYGAARYGHFFGGLNRVHPEHRIPHVSLLLVGVLTLFWSFFDLEKVINALIATRILEQFVGQIIGVMLLRRSRPDLPRPFRIWLYPLPCFLALAGWLYVYVTMDWLFILVALATLLTGTGVFLLWSRYTRRWPFEEIRSGQ